MGDDLILRITACTLQMRSKQGPETNKTTFPTFHQRAGCSNTKTVAEETNSKECDSRIGIIHNGIIAVLIV